MDTQARHHAGVPWTVQKLHTEVRDLPVPQGSPLLLLADSAPGRTATSDKAHKPAPSHTTELKPTSSLEAAVAIGS